MDNVEVRVIGIIEQDDNVVVTKNRSNFWHFPSGRVKEGEHHIDGLIREMFEKTGLDVSVKCMLYENNKSSHRKLTKWYLCEPVSGELTVGRKLLEAKYVPRNEVLNNVDESVRANMPGKIACYLKGEERRT